MKKYILFVLIFLPLLVLFFIYQKKSKENDALFDQIAIVRKQIIESRNSNAHSFAPLDYQKAIAAYDSAMFFWNVENEKFFLVRDYGLCHQWADKAVDLAGVASQKGGDNYGNLISEFRQIKLRVENEIELYQLIYNKIPQPEPIRKSFTKASILYREALLLSENNDHHKSILKLNEALANLVKCNEFCDNKVNAYFADYNVWNNLVAEGIANSKKQKSSCIIVDKFSRKCHLYKNGTVAASYDVDLGENWMVNKKYQGDLATPEGKYRVIEKKQNGSTKYYKALLINYPNEDDKDRFEKNKLNGSIPARKKIGGLIELHGHGGKGADWTQGCVALSDSDMDDLYALVKIGTPVIIVGSIKPLDFHFKIDR
ncbi:MAG TPA: L,D-transpeptidase [Prolixibacteraceae bacterium]|nr:L,D-transpeptidase [Prolixibacteraceae bacterium]